MRPTLILSLFLSRLLHPMPPSHATPDLSTWPLSLLHSELARYGFKRPSSRRHLESQLTAIYHSLASASHPAPSPTQPQPTAQDAIVLSSDEEPHQPHSEEPKGNLTLQLEDEAGSSLSSSPSRSPSPSSEDIPLSSLPSAPPPPATTTASTNWIEVYHTSLPRLIKSTPHLYERILRYEPVPLDEIVSLLHQHRLPADTGRKREAVKLVLDKESICFTTEELEGKRSRH